MPGKQIQYPGGRFGNQTAFCEIVYSMGVVGPFRYQRQTTEHSSCQAYQEQPPKAMIAMYQREKGNNFNWWEVQKAPFSLLGCLFSRRYRPLVCLTSCRSCYSSRIPSLVISLMLLSSHGGHLINAYFFSLSYLIIRAEISAHRCRN